MSKSIVKTAKSTAPIVQFYLAEDLRQEVTGKVSAIGLYPDRAVVLNFPENIPDPTLEHPMAVHSLGFMFNISNLNEPVEVSIEMAGDSETKPFLAPSIYGPIEPGMSLNLLSVMQPCLITSFGTKVVVIKVGDLDYSFQFEVRRLASSGQQLGKHIQDVPKRKSILAKKRVSKQSS
jgi:hypothetical protein